MSQIFTDVKGAARECGVSTRTIWRVIRAGRLKTYRTPSGRVRIKRADLIKRDPVVAA